MTERFEKKQSCGFSLVETLAVVAILVILLSVSAVAAAYYRDYLKITELDNAAREIYMAAENRAVLLEGGGQLDAALGVTSLAEGGTPAQPIFIAKDEAAGKGLLTAGAIDPALLDGDFYIFYDPSSGAVTDVFYAEKPINQMSESDTAVFYEAWSGASRDARMRPGDMGPMLGYYGGEQKARDPYTPLPAPEVMVEIENAERLTVKVTFKIPEAARKLMGGYNETALNENTYRAVTLTYPGKVPVTLFDSAAGGSTFPNRLIVQSGTLSSGSISYTWVLDELDAEGTPGGRRFYSLFKGTDSSGGFGEDFTVSAEITLSADGRRPTGASGQDTDNSLFAARSGGETARLENVRHLQNLDRETSRVGGKTAAVQLADIDCYGATAYPKYAFVPVVNPELLAFDGGWSVGEDGKNRRNEILDLHVTEESAKGKNGAGLFAETNDGIPEEPVTFTGVRLINAVVEFSKPSGALAGVAGTNNTFRDIQVTNANVRGRTAAGGLVGSAGHSGTLNDNTKFQNIRVLNTQVDCTEGAAGGVAGKISGMTQAGDFKNCWVYWDKDEQQDVRNLMLGGGYIYKEDDSDAYKIKGSAAGGLAGELAKAGAYSLSTSIENCLAASTIQGTNYAGGFIGRTEGNTNLLKSYTDCYLSGGNAAGMAGRIENGCSFLVEDAYTAGFIDMRGTQKAAGFCLGSSKVETNRAYTALYYSRQAEGTDYTGRIFQLTETQETINNDTFHDTYYLDVNYGHEYESLPPPSLGGSPDCQARLVTYSELVHSDFPSKIGGAFGRKTTGTTFPFNLQEHLKLESYEFPGLKNLPHYGDWNAEFSKPSLVYYEQYDGRIGFSGGNARYLSDEQFKIGSLNDLTIRSDGYAVAFLKEDVKGNHCQIHYTYLDSSNPAAPVLRKDRVNYAVGDAANPLLSASWDGKEYYLAPLPQEMVTGDRTSPDFFQYLSFSASNAEGLNASGESFYNPHFAEAVMAYTSEDGSRFLQPEEEGEKAAASIAEYVCGELLAKRTRGVASVRTPRHLFHLSQFQDYYHNTKHRLTFQQELDLDGGQGVYTGYPDLLQHQDGVQLQSRIGTEAAPFRGVYDGNFHTIRRLAFRIPKPAEDSTQVAAGLFGHSNGTLRNIVYDLGETAAVDAAFPSSQKHTYLGALVGRNGSVGTVENCAAEGVRLNLRAYTSTIYVGGLAGLNEGRIQGSAAECALIHVEGNHYASAYVGGLTGRNQNGPGVSASYAVGRLSANADKDTAPVYLSGFAGWNSGTISGSYSAMDLRTDGAGAKAFGFCGKSEGGRQSGTYYLNKGNFSYRDQEFSANYDSGEGSSARSVTYRELTAEPSIVSGMSRLSGKEGFPYPAVVTGARGLTHYGSWPAPLDFGEMGVYYWEERDTGKGFAYDFTLLAVKPDQTISKISTLSRAHDQGDVVTRWGYGYYNAAHNPINTLTSENLLYSIKGGGGQSFGELFAKKQLAAQQIPEVDEALARQKNNAAGPDDPQFEFHSFLSFGMEAGRGGLYPDATPERPNAVLSLSQSGNVTVRFTLNPFFAEALSVEYPQGWGPEAGASKNHIPPTDAPGSSNNAYGVRSIEQLELINWNAVNRDTWTAIHKNGAGAHNISRFPYLSSGASAEKYYWTQSHDVKGAEGQTYTPIAEYYDSTNENTPRGYLEGWFGGAYDGQRYTIENVSINDFTQEQQAARLSSCAGLFGVVYNGTLENILLYSSSGESTVKSIFNQNSFSQWYAIGALAGVAASLKEDGAPGETAVKNCAVSGYRIEANTFTKTSGQTWGGVGVGGLLGLSNMSLTGCTAVADISLMEGTIANDNMRVGGLVGSCQGSVTNCYAGGSISVDAALAPASGKGIYIGGLVGGSYMKPLQVGSQTNRTIGFIDDPSTDGGDSKGWTSNTLTNCYSYVRLPSPDSNGAIRGLFAVGGAGEINAGNRPNAARNHGVSVKENCYYLESEVLSSVTREQLIQKAETSPTNFRTDLADTLYTLGSAYSESNFNSDTITVGRTRYYYMKSDPLRNGTRLFQQSGSSYAFRGWLGNYDPAAGSGTLVTVRDEAETGVTGLDYEQLSGKAPIGTAENIYQLLTGFRPVDTTTGDGAAVPGKYSYPPATRKDLQDRDYPFPTILTKEENTGRTCAVHYGGWPLNGFRRQSIPSEGTDPVFLGGSPIEIDLFAGKTYQEYLVLTEDVHSGGTWKAVLESQDVELSEIAPEQIVEVSQIEAVEGKEKTYRLRLDALRDGTDTLILSYTTPEGVTYTLPITVHVTSGVKLRPGRLFMFPDDTTEITVKAANRQGGLLEGGRLKLKGDPSCGDGGLLTAETIRAEQTDTEFPSVRLVTTGAPEGGLLMANAGFDYTMLGPDGGETDQVYGGGSGGDIRIDIIRPWTVSFPQPADPGDGGTKEPRTCVIAFPASFSVLDAGGNETDLLLFENLEAKVVSSSAAVTLSEEKNADGTVYTLTCAPDAETIPETRLSISLTMTSRNHTLIPEGEAQTHQLTLAVAESPEGEALPEGRAIEALPVENKTSRRTGRRGRKSYRRRS